MGYGHTQVGYVMIVTLGIGIVVIGLLMGILGYNSIGLTVIIILAVCLWLFCALTVELREGLLLLRFGPGFIWKRFQLKGIRSCSVVRNPWYYGYGVRWTPRGWLFRVSGLSSVEIQMESGKSYLIGSDEPDELARAILSASST